MKRAFQILLLVFSFQTGLMAQKVDWNVDFTYLFDNGEFTGSNNVYDMSATLHAARLTPSVGVLVPQAKGSVLHRVMLGADLLKDMGDGRENVDIFRELTLYYNAEASLSNGGRFSAIAGVFPRTFAEGDYYGVFFNDNALFYDNNLEGMFFKYGDDRLSAECGLDWMGLFGDADTPLRRERFQVLTAGSWNFAGDFHLDWTGTFQHFANSPTLDNIVDNDILNPRLRWSPETLFDETSLEAGGIFTYQWDRKNVSDPVTPMGLLLRQRLEKWHVGVDNRFYFGEDLMPYYESSYGGVQYGSDLYYGDRMFHTLHEGASWADNLAFYYTPKIAKFLYLTVAVDFRFGTPDSSLSVPVFRGSKQYVGLKLDLSCLRPQPHERVARRFDFGSFFNL